MSEVQIPLPWCVRHLARIASDGAPRYDLDCVRIQVAHRQAIVSATDGRCIVESTYDVDAFKHGPTLFPLTDLARAMRAAARRHGGWRHDVVLYPDKRQAWSGRVGVSWTPRERHWPSDAPLLFERFTRGWSGQATFSAYLAKAIRAATDSVDGFGVTVEWGTLTRYADDGEKSEPLCARIYGEGEQGTFRGLVLGVEREGDRRYENYVPQGASTGAHA